MAKKKKKTLNRYNARIYRQGLKERKKIAEGYYSKVQGAELAPKITQEQIRVMLYGKKRPRNALIANALIKEMMVQDTEVTGRWAYASGIKPTKDSEDPFNILFVQTGKYDINRGYHNIYEFKRAFNKKFDSLRESYLDKVGEIYSDEEEALKAFALTQSQWLSFYRMVKMEFVEQLELKGDLARSIYQN